MHFSPQEIYKNALIHAKDVRRILVLCVFLSPNFRIWGFSAEYIARTYSYVLLLNKGYTESNYVCGKIHLCEGKINLRLRGNQIRISRQIEMTRLPQQLARF